MHESEKVEISNTFLRWIDWRTGIRDWFCLVAGPVPNTYFVTSFYKINSHWGAFMKVSKRLNPNRFEQEKIELNSRILLNENEDRKGWKYIFWTLSIIPQPTNPYFIFTNFNDRNFVKSFSWDSFTQSLFVFLKSLLKSKNVSKRQIYDIIPKFYHFPDKFLTFLIINFSWFGSIGTG